MISLFLTALLGLFCFSSFNINALDYTKEIEVREINNTKCAYNSDVDRYLTPISDVSSTYGYNVFKQFLDICYTGERYPNNSVLEDYPNGQSVTRAMINLESSNNSFWWVQNLNQFNIYYPNANNASVYINNIQLVTSGSQDYTQHRVDCYNGSSIAYRFYFYFYRPNNNLLSVVVPSVSRYGSGVVADVYDECICYSSNQFFNVYGDFDSAGSTTNTNNTAWTDGYNAGKQDGYNDALESFTDNETMLTIFSGIIEIGLLPVNIFLQILNFEVFGINIAGFVSAMLTISIVIIIIRFLFGGKSNV